jgi:anti-sigma-K factor RskA
MSTSHDDLARDPPDDDVLAAELVLGVLDAAQRAAAQARALAEPAFAARVAAWERRLGGLVHDVDPVAVPAHVWPRIGARLGWQGTPARGGLWESLAFWRGLGFAGLATAALLAVMLLRAGEPPAIAPAPIVVAPPAPVTPPSARVVTLAADSGAASFLATVDRARGHLRVTPVPAAADATGRVPELWLIPPGQAPVSLGVISTTWTHEVDVPEAHRWALGEDIGSLLAVSLEPQGGAPGGAPTGPVVAKGVIDKG